MSARAREPDPSRALILAASFERAESLAEILREGTAVLPVEHVDGATPASPEGAPFGILIVSLDRSDPVEDARRTVRALGINHVVFVGTDDERAEWERPVLYEPLLPRFRRVVPLRHDAVTGAVSVAVTDLRRRARTREVLGRVEIDAAQAKPQGGEEGIGSVLSRAVVDSLAPQGPLRDAYAAIVRGAIGEGDVAAEGADLARGLRRVLRRVEILRGAEERDRVAEDLARAIEALQPERFVARVNVRSQTDVEKLQDAFARGAEGIEVRPAVLDGFREAVGRILASDLANGESTGDRGALVRVEFARHRVTASWTSPGGTRHVSTFLSDEPFDAARSGSDATAS